MDKTWDFAKTIWTFIRCTTVKTYSSITTCFVTSYQKAGQCCQPHRRNHQPQMGLDGHVTIPIGQDGLPCSDQIHETRHPSRANDSNNSTTTEEGASDDSLLGSPNMEHTGTDGWRITQSVLTLESGQRENDLGWNMDNASCASPIGTNDQDAQSSCTTLGACDCGHMKTILAELKLANGRIAILQERLSALGVEEQEEHPSPPSPSRTIQSEDSHSQICQVITTSESTDKLYNDENGNSIKPILVSSPPPAPPLPPAGKFENQNLKKSKKSVPAPKCSLKTLNWIKLKEESLRGTVWVEMDDEKMYELLDLNQLEKHFSCATNYDAYGTIRSRMSVCSAMREVSVLDVRRAQNCAILLSKLKLTNREIKEAIQTLDDKELIPKDMAEQLLKFIPTKQELKLLAPYQEAKDVLHPADRYFLEISRMKRYEQRLRCMCVKKSFPETSEEALKKMNTIIEASRRVLASRRLRKLLSIVLALGNYLNHSKRSSDACAYHLSALCSLQDMKSSVNGEYTLLHYLVDSCNRTIPDLLQIQQETTVCVDAAKVCGPELQLEMKKLEEGVRLVSDEIDACHSYQDDANVQFSTIVAKLLHKYREDLSILENSFKQMKNAFFACCKAYSPEDNYEETLNISEFFGHFGQFLQQFTTVETQMVRKRREQEIRTLTMNRARAKKKPIPSNTVHSSRTHSYNQWLGRSSRKGKQRPILPDSNEELLTSVLLAMNQGSTVDRTGKPNVNIIPPRQRRSFRLSIKRKQLKSIPSTGRASGRRRTVEKKSGGHQELRNDERGRSGSTVIVGDN